MKTIRILVLCLFLATAGVQAQDLYVRVGAGFALSTAGTWYQDINNSGTVNTTEATKKGYGTGIPLVLAPGYKLNEHFAVELGIDYFNGFTITTSSTDNNEVVESKRSGKMLSLVPSFVITLPMDKFEPYGRFGIKIGLLNNVVFKDHAVNSGNPQKEWPTGTTDEKSKDYGGLALGVQGALGTNYALSDLISLFGEIQIDGISFSPKHGKIISSEVNGVDRMESLTENVKSWDYEKEVDYNAATPADEPGKRVKTNHRFGNVGLMIGVRINLNFN